MRGYSGNREEHLDRLRHIEARVRDLARMLDDDRDAVAVVGEVAAVTRGLQRIAVELLDEHVRCCVTAAAASGDAVWAGAMVAEASRAIERLVKS